MKQDFQGGAYQEILEALTRRDVEFIVGGGVACVLHGVERVTMDIDVSVLLTPANFAKFESVMKEIGLKPRVPVSPEVLLNPEMVRLMVEEKGALVFTFVDPDRPFRQVDVFLGSDLSYASLLPDAVWVDMGGVRLRVIGRRRLLQIKLGIQPPRTKDVIDIEWLRNNQA